MLRIPSFIIAMVFVAGCNSRIFLPCTASGECASSSNPATSHDFRALSLTVADASDKISTYTCAPVTLWVKDRGGSALAVTETTQVSLTGLGAGLAYATLPDCQSAASSVSNVFLSIGQDHLVFYYRTATAESLTLQAAATAFDAASLAVTTVLFQVLGQSDAHSSTPLAKANGAPTGVYGDGTRLFVADRYNNRVLVWGALPTTSGQAASFALGQPDLTSNTNNYGGLSASSMSTPSGVYSDGTRLFVADSGNHRVLVWNTMPTSSGQAANFALGQPNLISGAANNGGLSASSMNSPSGVYSDGTRLFVVDYANHRVLVWNALPTTSGQAADFALGQPDLTSNTANNGGVSASSMNNPYGVYGDGTRLFVADQYNNRVLVWSTLPTTSGQAADFALGQAGLVSNGNGVSSITLFCPSGVYSDGTRLFVSDRNNHRVLVWNTIPTTSGQAASFALGQPDLNSNIRNNGAFSASSMYFPLGVYSNGTRLFVADSGNNRVMVWDTMPTTSGQIASLALGQPDLTSNLTNNNGFPASLMSSPSGIYSDGTRLFVADGNNNRVLVWNTMPTTSGQAASFALGQPDLTSNSINNGGISASTMYTPLSVYSDGTRLFVADGVNHRVLVWNTMPTTNGQAASFALGQPDLTSNTANNGGVTASSMNWPVWVYSDGTRLFVADRNNDRILVWNTMPTTNGQAASFALGQADLTSNTPNSGGLSASSMYFPSAVYSAGTRLIVVDRNNSRVLVWNTMPTTSNQAASFVLGQPNLTSNAANNGGLSASSMSSPAGVYSDGTRVFTADTSNNRILISPLP